MYYVILLISLIITFSAQIYINSTYKSVRKIKSNTGFTGYQVARKILDSNGLENVRINRVDGELSDHYDPKTKTVNLSDDIYDNTSLASVSVAAHEVGHAIQDKDGYFFLKFRRSILPLVNFASKAGYLIIVISIFSSLTDLLWIGIILELVILLFQVVTLPVEFNASSRALKQILKLNIVDKREQKSCRRMLTAAALTYVASVCTAILEVLRLVMIARNND